MRRGWPQAVFSKKKTIRPEGVTPQNASVVMSPWVFVVRRKKSFAKSFLVGMLPI
jgi:hypothetical protein